MGLLKFTPTGWQELRQIMSNNLPKPVEKIDMTGLLSCALTCGAKICAVPYNGLWLEVDNEHDLTVYEGMKAKQKKR